MVFPSTWMDLVANSTPMVDLDSRLNSFLVNLESRFDLPTPESPMRTTGNKLWIIRPCQLQFIDLFFTFEQVIVFIISSTHLFCLYQTLEEKSNKILKNSEVLISKIIELWSKDCHKRCFILEMFLSSIGLKLTFQQPTGVEWLWRITVEKQVTCVQWSKK